MPDYSSEDARRHFMSRAGFDPDKVFQIEEHVEEIVNVLMNAMVDENDETLLNEATTLELVMSRALGKEMNRADYHGLSAFVATAMLAVRIAASTNIAYEGQAVGDKSVLEHVPDMDHAPKDAAQMSHLEVSSVLCNLIVCLTRARAMHDEDEEGEADQQDG